VDLLQIRSDTSLFRLRTAQDVIDRVKFHNTGPSQVAGVIAMSIDGVGYQHAKYKKVVVFFNVDKEARDITIGELRNDIFGVHKVQRNSNNDALAKTATYNRATGTFRIPPRTTVVFVSTAPVPF
jgi:hypothetical protein